MSHDHQDGRMYRMPYGFGPSAGPRQGGDGAPFDWSDSPDRQSIGVSFLTAAPSLERLLPPGFSLAGEPVVTVELQVLRGLKWLAGRGYSMLQVRFPARYEGKRDDVAGSFLCVLWENLADPILTGREELGFAKLWCDLPEPREYVGAVTCTASWLSCPFAEVVVRDLEEAEPMIPAYPGLDRPSDGTLHYKYIPKTGAWGEAAVAHACLTPPGGKLTVRRVRKGRGNVRFTPVTWEQMPTQFHIVNALAALPVFEQVSAWVTEAFGGNDLSSQRALE